MLPLKWDPGFLHPYTYSYLPHTTQTCVSSAQFLDHVHHESYQNMTTCVMGLPLALMH